VLFGEHFVKLDAIANTSGHIGSNDFVEVKNGNSAIVAGDLRAGRTIKVQGAIAADYAYAGRNIDVVQKAALKLSGNSRAPFAVPAYTIAAPAAIPPLQGNVWVAGQPVEASPAGSRQTERTRTRHARRAAGERDVRRAQPPGRLGRRAEHHPAARRIRFLSLRLRLPRRPRLRRLAGLRAVLRRTP
jgi:hypothetical protein